MRHVDAETVYEFKVLHRVLCVFFFGKKKEFLC